MLERRVHGKAYREGDRSFLWCLYVLRPSEDNLRLLNLGLSNSVTSAFAFKLV